MSYSQALRPRIELASGRCANSLCSPVRETCSTHEAHCATECPTDRQRNQLSIAGENESANGTSIFEMTRVSCSSRIVSMGFVINTCTSSCLSHESCLQHPEEDLLLLRNLVSGILPRFILDEQNVQHSGTKSSHEPENFPTITFALRRGLLEAIVYLADLF